MKESIKTKLWWAVAAASGVILAYFFAELFFFPGLLQVGSGSLGLLVAFVLPRCRFLEVVGSSLIGLMVATSLVLVILPFNHHGDRSLFASFMILHWISFLVGAAISMWLTNRRSRRASL